MIQWQVRKREEFFPDQKIVGPGTFSVQLSGMSHFLDAIACLARTDLRRSIGRYIFIIFVSLRGSPRGAGSFNWVYFLSNLSLSLKLLQLSTTCLYKKKKGCLSNQDIFWCQLFLKQRAASLWALDPVLSSPEIQGATSSSSVIFTTILCKQPANVYLSECAWCRKMIGRAHAFVTDRQFPKSDLRSTNIGVWQSGAAQSADLETRRFSFTFTWASCQSLSLPQSNPTESK